MIKELGTNGGGYFNANSAHPYENPNAWTNMLEIFLILVIPVSLTRTFGKMVGRTPEYLGKHIGVSEITKVSLYILVMPTLVLAGVGISAMLPSTRDVVSTSGSHGFSDLDYAFTSASNNNGSAFAGFGANTPWFNITLDLRHGGGFEEL